MKKLHIQKLVPFLLAALLAGLAPWYYRVYIDWRPALYVIAFIAATLVMAALSLSVYRKLWKTLLSTGIFSVVILFGVSYLINNVIGNEGMNRQAAAASLALAGAQVLVLLLWNPWRAIGRRAKIAICVAVPLLAAAAASSTLWMDARRDRLLLEELDRSGIFAGSAQDALPQTAVHDMIIEHFARERDDGTVPKGLIIGYDGARADALTLTADDPQSAVQALKAQGGGIYNMYCGGDAPRTQSTSTSPGWTNLLTGHWANEPGGGHGIKDNGIVKAPDAPKLIFNNLFDQGLAGQAAFVVSWDEYFAYPGAVWYHDKVYAEERGYNIRWLNQAYTGDAGLFEAGLEEIQNPANDFVMVTLDACDYAGHGYGFDPKVPEYARAFTESEHYAFELIQAVKARPAYADEDWLIIVTADHGGIGTGHGRQNAQSRQIFMAVNQ